MTVVTTPALAASDEEVMILVDVARPFTVEVRVLRAEVRSLLLRKLAVVVATLPFTVLVSTKELVEVEMVSVFEVEEATRLVRSVDVATPLMVVVRIAPEVESSLLVMRDVVATTPFTVVVRVFPVTDCVKELMMVASEEEIPLTIVWKTLREEEAVFEVMIVEVPIDPPMFEESVLPEEESVLEVERLVTERLVAVAEVETRLLVVRLLDTVRLVVEALASAVCPVTVREVRLATPRSAP